MEVDVPQGRLIRRIPVPKPHLEAEVVIARPKLKTHFLDPITGAIKLWVGAARQDAMHRLQRDCVQETWPTCSQSRARTSRSWTRSSPVRGMGPSPRAVAEWARCCPRMTRSRWT